MLRNASAYSYLSKLNPWILSDPNCFQGKLATEMDFETNRKQVNFGDLESLPYKPV